MCDHPLDLSNGRVCTTARAAIDDLCEDLRSTTQDVELDLKLLREYAHTAIEIQRHCASCRWRVQMDIIQQLCEDALLARLLSIFSDLTDRERHQAAGDLLMIIWRLNDNLGTHPFSQKLISAAGSSRNLISTLARVVEDEVEPPVEQRQLSFQDSLVFLWLTEVMREGRRCGNATDFRDYLVEHHPSLLRILLAWAEAHLASDAALVALLTSLSVMFETRNTQRNRHNQDGPPFPPIRMPPFLWAGLWEVLIKIMIRQETSTRGDNDEVHATTISLLICTIVEWLKAAGSEDDCIEYINVLENRVFPEVDKLAGILTSPDAPQELRRSAALCVERIFRRCHDFMGLMSDYRPSEPVERLMRSPGALKAFVQHIRAAVDYPFALALPGIVARCGYRDEVYAAGCISLLASVAEGKHRGTEGKHMLENTAGFCAVACLYLVGEKPDDMTDALAKIAVREGLPAALCEICIMCFEHLSDADKVKQFVDFTLNTLRALVAYGDRVSSRRGSFRPNTVTQAILQHESIKTMRAAGRQPKGRRKAHHQQQPTVPKELLDYFDEIENAANERADAQLMADLGIDDGHEGAKQPISSTKSGKSKGKLKGATAAKEDTKQAPLASVSATGTLDDHSEQQEDTEEHHDLPGPLSPSPSSPPRPSSAAGGPSVSEDAAELTGLDINNGKKAKAKRRGKVAKNAQATVANDEADEGNYQADVGAPPPRPPQPTSHVSADADGGSGLQQASNHDDGIHVSCRQRGKANLAAQGDHRELPFSLPPPPPFPAPTAPPPPPPPPPSTVPSSSPARPPAAAAAAAASSSPGGGAFEGKEIKCCVCLVNAPDILLLPCRHKVVCGECFDKWMAPMPREDRICPEHTCRQPYSEATRIL